MPQNRMQSSWIQRLKPAAREDSDGELQIPLKNLALGENEGSGKRNLQIHSASDKTPKGFGSFRVRVGGVKFRKPPLPPSSKPIKPPDFTVRLDNRLKLHQVDIRLEQLHQTGAEPPPDPLADLASRLDIREKSTLVGTFHVANRKLVKRKVNRFKSKEKGLIPGLTPVVSPKGSYSFVFPANQVSTNASVVAGFTNLTTQGNQSHASVRTVSTACCGSSSFPETVTPQSDDNTDLLKEPETKCSPADQEVEELRIAGKRSNECSDRLVPSESKRSRLSVEGSPGNDGPVLAGPWLNRWTIRDGPRKKTSEPPVKVQPQQRFGIYFPDDIKTAVKQQPESSAAALAIVGAAMRQIQTYSSQHGLEVVKVHTSGSPVL